MLAMLLLLNMVLPLLILPMVLPLNQIMVHPLHPQMMLMVLPQKTTVPPNPLMPLLLAMVPLPLRTMVHPLLQIMVHQLQIRHLLAMECPKDHLFQDPLTMHLNRILQLHQYSTNQPQLLCRSWLNPKIL